MSWTIGVDSIDHMVQQRFYQSGGITAPPHAVEGGTKWTFWHFENRSGYGPPYEGFPVYLAARFIEIFKQALAGGPGDHSHHHFRMELDGDCERSHPDCVYGARDISR